MKPTKLFNREVSENLLITREKQNKMTMHLGTTCTTELLCDLELHAFALLKANSSLLNATFHMWAHNGARYDNFFMLLYWGTHQTMETNRGRVFFGHFVQSGQRDGLPENRQHLHWWCLQISQFL